MARPPKRPSRTEKELGSRARKLRAKGYSYALIERQLGIPYLQARELAAQYDAKHGRPKRVVRQLPSPVTGVDPARIPVRELRNNVSGILRQVEKGQRFLITVSGRTVAELAPPSSRLVFVPRSAVESIIREAPLDAGFAKDVDALLGERIDEL